jgi:hypothetical protein
MYLLPTSLACPACRPPVLVQHHFLLVDALT